MKKNIVISKKNIVIFGVIAALVIAGIALYVSKNSKPGPLDAFARCLKEKNAVFYGAYWCPHCQTQKKMFGKSEKFLPYVECSTPDGQGQLPVCQEKKIEGYPTWEFADKSREAGEVPLEKLAEKTGCILPEIK